MGRGKTFFPVKKGFSPPPHPQPFSRKAGYVCSRWSQTGNINLSCPYSRSERFMFTAGKRFTLRSNASRRIYPALHVGLHRKPTQYKFIISLLAKRALHVCQRQTLHIAKQCFTQDLSCASRWFAAQTNTIAGYVCSRWSQNRKHKLIMSELAK